MLELQLLGSNLRCIKKTTYDVMYATRRLIVGRTAGLALRDPERGGRRAGLDTGSRQGLEDIDCVTLI